MVLVNYQTGDPLVPGDMEYDDSKPTADHVVEIFETYRDYYKTFHEQCEEEDEFYFGTRSVPVPDEMPVDPITRAFGPAYTQEERDTMALKEKEMITKNITRKHESMQKTGSALVKDIQSTPGFEEYAPRGMDEEVRRSLLSIPGAG